MARTLAAVVATTFALPALLGPPTGSPPAPSVTGETVSAPTVTGPLELTSPVGDPDHGYPFLATDVDLAAGGYVEEEFLISGEAVRYAADGQTDAARWLTSPTADAAHKASNRQPTSRLEGRYRPSKRNARDMIPRLTRVA